MTSTKLSETSPELLDALSQTLALTFGQEQIVTGALNTGGGCMVAAVDLSIDGRFQGRQAWLTREDETEWLLGFYDFATDPEDEGVTVVIRGNVDTVDSPLWIAAQVAAILSRLGVTLQGA